MKSLFLTLFLFILTKNALAFEEYYHFSSQAQQQRFITLTQQLRCLVCQNQTLADSNAPLADDLRRQIYHKIQEGKSNDDIIAYLISRYGNFILYRPPLNSSTLVLWFGPVVFLILAISMLLQYICRKSHTL